MHVTYDTTYVCTYILALNDTHCLQLKLSKMIANLAIE